MDKWQKKVVLTLVVSVIVMGLASSELEIVGTGNEKVIELKDSRISFFDIREVANKSVSACAGLFLGWDNSGRIICLPVNTTAGSFPESDPIFRYFQPYYFMNNMTSTFLMPLVMQSELNISSLVGSFRTDSIKGITDVDSEILFDIGTIQLIPDSGGSSVFTFSGSSLLTNADFCNSTACFTLSELNRSSSGSGVSLGGVINNSLLFDDGDTVNGTSSGNYGVFYDKDGNSINITLRDGKPYGIYISGTDTIKKVPSIPFAVAKTVDWNGTDTGVNPLNAFSLSLTDKRDVNHTSTDYVRTADFFVSRTSETRMNSTLNFLMPLYLNFQDNGVYVASSGSVNNYGMYMPIEGFPEKQGGGTTTYNFIGIGIAGSGIDLSAMETSGSWSGYYRGFKDGGAIICGSGTCDKASFEGGNGYLLTSNTNKYNAGTGKNAYWGYETTAMKMGVVTTNKDIWIYQNVSGNNTLALNISKGGIVVNSTIRSLNATAWSGYIACYLADGTLGHCTTSSGIGGTCTCAKN